MRNPTGIMRTWGCLVMLASVYAAPAWSFGYGPETCKQGYVWREACSPDDHVCVVPPTRAQAAQDNALAASRRQPGGGPYGPDTCKQGYVWREACGHEDHVCVVGGTRAQAAADNAQKTARFQSNIPLWDVLTQHNNEARDGTQLHETHLTPGKVSPSTFGKLYERNVNGQVIAQPLYVSNQWDPVKGLRNVVYVATRANTVYAFDADDLDPNPAHGLIWSAPVTVEPAAPVPNMCQETRGPLGVTATPVIDRAANVMYLVARKSDGTIWLVALDIATGTTKRSVRITASQNGVQFDQSLELSRAGLLMMNGALYVGFSALNCDNAGWHGWVIAYRAPDLTQVGAFVTTTAQNEGGGIWASGKGLVGGADQASLFFETGNGAVSGNDNLGESFVKLIVGPEPFYGLTLADHYTVSNWQALNNGDTDLGSSGPLLLPGNRLVGGGKQGKLYVLNSANLQPTQNGPAPGGVPPGGSDGFQAFINTWHNDASQPTCMTPGSMLGTHCFMPHARYEEGELTGPNIHSGPVYWNDRLYGMPEKDFLRAFSYSPATGVLATSPAAVSTVRSPDGMPGAALEISANGNQDGIVWANIPKYDGQWQNVPGRLVAFDAITLHELWRDDDDIAYAKFNPPTVGGGKVFRPTFADKLIVYGEKNGATPAGCYTVDAVYQNFTGADGLLANPTGAESTAPDGVGRFRNYQGGYIYWSPSTCGFEVSGAIGGEYAAMGFSAGALGYPLTDETPTPDGIGRYNHFQHGSIYWTAGTGAHEVQGLIRDRWASLGWERSDLGYPVSDETDEIDGSGRFSLFEHGVIHWKRADNSITVQADLSILLGPLQGGTDQLGMDIVGTTLPQPNPAMCEANCAANSSCKAWTYVAPNTTQGPLPHCYIKNGVPLPSAAACCTSGLKLPIAPSNMVPMQGAFDRLGSDFANFDLPSDDPRLCQAECSANASCKAWSYVTPNGALPHCWLKNAKPAPNANECCTSGAKQ